MSRLQVHQGGTVDVEVDQVDQAADLPWKPPAG